MWIGNLIEGKKIEESKVNVEAEVAGW